MNEAFTAGERALMVERVAEQERLHAARRASLPAHDVPPATRFDPRLPGWVPPDPIRWAVPDRAPGPLPDSADDIAFAPVASLAHWLRRGLTAERLTTIYLDRIARHAGPLACFATVTPDLAIAQARGADARLAAGEAGALIGIPYGCKDILDTAGITTSWGAEPYRDRVPEADATVVRRLAEAGAVLLGKTSVGALAMGDVWFGGLTRNPWNPLQGASGSSAGSAAAVAAGLCAFALGTETLGSIVCPSLRCGTAGLRPTFGRIPRTGAMPLAWSLDKIGVIARTIDDAALVLPVLAGPDGADAAALDLPLGGDTAGDVAGLRIGWFPADLAAEGAIPLDRTPLDILREHGCTLVPLSRPARATDALPLLLSAEAAASFEELTLSGRDDELTRQDAEAWPNEFRAAHLLSAVGHVQLDRLRTQVMRDMAETFTRVDAIVGPPTAGPMLTITNFSGHPCAIVRTGFSSPDTPHAACIWAPLFDEATAIRVARVIEAAQARPGALPLDPAGAGGPRPF